MKILIVEDTVVIRVILKRWLRTFGVSEANIIEADNGEAALKRFESSSPDAVITDWNMPIMDGLTLVQAIRQRDKKVPILMITMQSERDQVVSALQAGANDYLIKPFPAADLRNKLSRLLQKATDTSESLTAVER